MSDNEELEQLKKELDEYKECLELLAFADDVKLDLYKTEVSKLRRALLDCGNIIHYCQIIECEDGHDEAFRDIEKICKEVLAEVHDVNNTNSSCPCIYTEPCHVMCSCVKGFSSRGCKRCCRYGSYEEREKVARILAEKLDRE